MDTRRIDGVGSVLTFDLLKTWYRDALYCDVGRTDPPGCPWMSLTWALRRAKQERLREEAAAAVAAAAQRGAESDCGSAEKVQEGDGPTEQDLRRCLVDTYARALGQTLQSILKAKMEDPLSFFHSFRTLSSAYRYWAWYLYCLTFEVLDFAGGAVEEGVINMPLDTVDLQVLASAFSTQITLSRLMEEPLRFLPDVDHPRQATQRAHVLCHRGLWSPMLGPTRPENEVLPLVNGIIELGRLPLGPMAALSQKTAVVKGYDRSNECYVVCVGQLDLPVDRLQIKNIVFHDRVASESWRGHVEGGDEQDREMRHSSLAPGEAALLRGVPDGAIEFQLLHELVRRQARAKLEAMLQELAGRGTHGPSHAASQRHSTAHGPVPEPVRQELLSQLCKPPTAPSWQPAQRPSEVVGAAVGTAAEGATGAEAPARMPTDPEGSAVMPSPATATATAPAPLRRMSMDQARLLMSTGRQIAVIAPQEWIPPEGSSSSSMALRLGAEIVLRRHADSGWLYGAEASSGSEGWFPTDRLTIWEVHQAFAPDPQSGNSALFLSLQVGETIAVHQRYSDEWDGWGWGQRWGGATVEGGVFHFSHTSPHVILSREL
mmetsp:Transcript_39426/g.111682  ORF Transcript_39426/g.111682 Transcript_39426/m.111682 type:complete len:602 (-) Transcript_39426:20-1825(-)